MMRFVADLRVPLPRAFQMAAEFALNGRMRTAFENADNLDFSRINALLDESRSANVALDGATLGFALKKTIKLLSERLLEKPGNMELIKTLECAAALTRSLPFEVDVWRAQNNYYEMLLRFFPEQLEKSITGDGAAKEWVDHFVALGQNLSIRVDQPAREAAVITGAA
jgi:hypothetical protein